MLSLAVVGVQTRRSIKRRTFHVGIRSSREVETKTVHDSTVTVTNVVPSLTYRLMWLHRLLRVYTAKMSVPQHPRVRIK